MGLEKRFRPELASAGEVSRIQALTGASTGTQVTNYGVTKIVVTTGEGTAANLVYTLAEPIAGVRKTIIADLNSTKTVEVRTLTSAAVFFGSTKNAVLFSTGSTFPPTNVELLGFSSVQWAVMDIRTPGSTAAAALTIQGSTA